MGTEENKALIRHVIELMNKGTSGDVYLDICDSNYVEHFLDHDESLEQVKQRVPSNRTDYSVTLDHLLADGDKVAYSVTHRWTDAATEKKIKITSTCIVRMENGKIMENWVLGDILHILQQRGVLPSTEEILKNAENNTN